MNARDEEVARIMGALARKIHFWAPEALVPNLTASVALAFERGYALGLTAPGLPTQLRTSTDRCVELAATLRAHGVLEDDQALASQLAKLVELTTAETLALAVGAIRLRAEYLKRVGYSDDHVSRVRHVAYWLASDAGRDALKAAVDAADAKEG